MRADEARTQLNPCRAHFQIACNRATTGNSARYKNRQLIAKLGQDFLRQNRCRHRADMPARFTALNDQSINAGAREFLGERQSRGEANDLCTKCLDRFNAALGWKSTRNDNMADVIFCADVDQFHDLRMHGD